MGPDHCYLLENDPVGIVVRSVPPLPPFFSAGRGREVSSNLEDLGIRDSGP